MAEKSSIRRSDLTRAVKAAPKRLLSAVSSTQPDPADGATVAGGAITGVPDMATSFTPNFTGFVPVPEAFQTAFGDFQARAKASLEKGAKLVEDFGEFSKGNVEALMTSGRVAAKGAETLGQDAAEYGKQSVEAATAAFKGLAAAKSPTEFFSLQSDYARKAFDTAVAEGSRVSEAVLKLAGDIVQPLSSRAAVAAERFKATAN